MLMKPRIVFSSFCFLAAAFISCRSANPDRYTLAQALERAGENRAELERVLQYYTSPADSLKKKAAIFLITYMPGKYAKVYPAYDQLKPVFDTLEALNAAYERRTDIVNPVAYKLYKQTVVNDFLSTHGIRLGQNLPYSIEEDIKCITAAYLIENIEYAFKVKDLPWNRTLSFSDFCEFILPYRYGNEELTPWRKAYYEENSHLLDSFQHENDPLPVCMAIKGLHGITRSEIAELRPVGNAIKPLDLIRINTTTSCQDETGVVVLRLRALGLPVSVIRFPNWGNRGSGHDINGLLTLDRTWFPLNGGTNTARYVPAKEFKIGKAFAETYSYDDQSSAVGGSGTQYVRLPNFRDATEYVTAVSDVAVSFQTHSSNSLGCLCVFNNANWIPLTCERIQGRRARFAKVGKGVIYLKGVLENGNLITEGQPFLLDADGEVVPFEPSDSQVELTLGRKYPPNEGIINFLPTLVGSYFQGANKADFSDAITLWRVDSLPTLHKIRASVPPADYRYVRFVFADFDRENEALGGVQLYGAGGQLLQGVPISSDPGLPTFYRHLFDNSPLTFVRIFTKKHSDFDRFYDGGTLVVPGGKPFWVGLDLEREQSLTAVEVSPRTDDNDVNIGETYELFYWGEGHWVSLGKQTATSIALTYMAPAGSLYLLKNAEKGREHRIFDYTANQQVWY